MAQIPIGDLFMKVDDEDVALFEAIKLRVSKSRNCLYAGFGKNGTAHRLIMGATDPLLVVDHINGDGLDNRKANLRVVTSSVNVKNRRTSRSKTNGMPPGMWPYRGRIAVQITEDHKKLFIGYFDCADAARAALNEARKAIGRPPV